MSEQFIGCNLSLEVGGGLGFYQGIVKYVNPKTQLITLTKVLHNGKPHNKPEVTINGADILDLKILSMKEAAAHELQLQNSSGQVQKSSGKSTSFPNHNNSHKSASFPNLIDLNNRENTTSSPKKKNNPNTSNNNPSIVEAGSKSTNSTGGFHGPPNAPLVQDNTEHKNSTQQSNDYNGMPTNVKRKSRTSVGELLAHGPHSSDLSKTVPGNGGVCHAFNPPMGDYGHPWRPSDGPPMQNKRLWSKQRKNNRDETTFGTPIDDDVLNTEFDFEKNLALFDKQAVMEEIQNQTLKPDVVRQADKKTERKYRCDENILASKPQPKRQIMVPADEAGEIIYSTDNGLLVPSVSTALRMNLLSTANQSGLTKSRQLEMMGRAATEIIVSIIGGSHRLEPGNSHQAPVVVLLCGANSQGAAGVNCGRQLECQGVQTTVVIPPMPASPTPCLLLSHETQLYAMTSGKMTTNVQDLPATVDLIVDARFDLQGHVGLPAQTWLSAVNLWASTSRAPVVALDPPCDIVNPVTPRIRLCPSLPLAYSDQKAKLYLMNLNIPQQVFTSLGIKYTSPFGPKMVITLHPRE